MDYLYFPLYILGGIVIWIFYKYLIMFRNILSLHYSNNPEFKLIQKEEVPQYLSQLFLQTEEDLMKRGFSYKFSFSRKNEFVGSKRESFSSVYYNSENSTIATISLSPFLNKQFNPIDITFSTHLEDQRKIITHRCLKDLYISIPQDCLIYDSLAIDLDSHLSFHIAKVKESKTKYVFFNFDIEEQEKLLQKTKDNFIKNHKDFSIQTEENGHRLKLKTSFKMVFKYFSFNKKYSTLLKPIKAKKTYCNIPLEVRVDEHIYLNEMLAMFDNNYKAKVFVFIFSLLLFILSYFFIIKSLKYTIILTLILLFHELGHAIMMRKFGCKDLQVMFLPFLGAIAQATNKNVSVVKQLVYLFAGPLPGIVMGIIIYILDQQFQLNIDSNIYLYIFFLNYFNLLPIYPLDGGQILDLIIFSRNYFLKIIFQFLSLIGSLLICYFLKSFTLLVISYVICLKIYYDFKLYKVIKELKLSNTSDTIEELDLLKRIIPTLDKYKIKFTHGKLNYLVGILNEKKCLPRYLLGFLVLYFIAWTPAIYYIFNYNKAYFSSSSNPVDYFENNKKCALYGNHGCYSSLAYSYQYGYGTSKNMAEAIKYYELAANNNNSYAYSSLGFIYQYGNEVVTKDYKKALKYYQLAFDSGNIHSAKEIAQLYLNGSSDLNVDLEKSFEWYKKGAELGDAYAQVGLADLYYKKDNMEEALYWYLMAYKNEEDYEATDDDEVSQKFNEIKSKLSAEQVSKIENRVKTAFEKIN